jgi:hypothetical protein
MASVKRKHEGAGDVPSKRAYGTEHEKFINSNTIVDVLSYDSVFSFIFRVIESDSHKYNGWVLKMCVLSLPDDSKNLPPFLKYHKASVTSHDFKKEVNTQRKVHTATLKYDPYGFCPYISLFGEIVEPRPFLDKIASRDKLSFNALLHLKRIFDSHPLYQLGYIIMENVSGEYVPIESRKPIDKNEMRWIAIHAWVRLLLIYKDTAIVHVDAHDSNILCKQQVDEDTPSAVTVLDFGNEYVDGSPLTKIDTIDDLFLMIQRFAQKDFIFNDRETLQCEFLLKALFPRMKSVPSNKYKDPLIDRDMVSWTEDTNVIYSRNLTDILTIMQSFSRRTPAEARESPPIEYMPDESRSKEVAGHSERQSYVLQSEAAERAIEEQKAAARKSYKNMIRDRDREERYRKAKQDAADAELDQQVQEELDRQEQEKEKQKQERMVQLKYNNKLKKYVLAGAVVVVAAYLLSGRTKKRRRRTKRRN